MQYIDKVFDVPVCRSTVSTGAVVEKIAGLPSFFDADVEKTVEIPQLQRRYWASTLLQLLQSMGLGQDLLTQVEAKLSPPLKKEPGPEKGLTTLKGKIHMCQQQLVKLRKKCDSAVKTFLELEQKFIAKEKDQHEYSQEYQDILQNKKLTRTPSEKGAEETLVEPIQEDEGLTPVDESKVTVEKGSPPPEPVLSQDRTALGLETHKALTAGERPQFMDIRKLGSSRFSPYDSEAKRLRLWKRRER